MGFAVTQHLRALHIDRSHALILGFTVSPEGRPFAIYIRENGALALDTIDSLQVEMHYNDEANQWEDDWPLPPGDVEDVGGWLSELIDETQIDGDPELQGPDREPDGAGDSDPPGGSAGDVDAST